MGLRWNSNKTKMFALVFVLNSTRDRPRICFFLCLSPSFYPHWIFSVHLNSLLWNLPQIFSILLLTLLDLQRDVSTFVGWISVVLSRKINIPVRMTCQTFHPDPITIVIVKARLCTVKESVVIESVPHSDRMLEILWGPAHVRSPCQLKPPFTD